MTGTAAAPPSGSSTTASVVLGDAVAAARALDHSGARHARAAPHGRGHARRVTGRDARHGRRERLLPGQRQGQPGRHGAAGAGLRRKLSGAAVAAAGCSSEGRAAGTRRRGRRRGRHRCGAADASDSSPVSMTAIRHRWGQSRHSPPGLEDARERRRDLGVDLAGDDLSSGSYLSTWSPTCLSLADRPLGDALAELGHRHLRHVRSSSGLPDVARSVPHPAIPVEPGRSKDDRPAIDASPPRPRRWPGSPGCPAPRGRRVPRRGPRPPS